MAANPGITTSLCRRERGEIYREFAFKREHNRERRFNRSSKYQISSNNENSRPKRGYCRRHMYI